MIHVGLERLPRAWRVTLEWVSTVAGAIAIVLALKAWVVNPYRIPSSSMEPTLHCARPAVGCEAGVADRILANRFLFHLRSPRRGEIVVFHVPSSAVARGCAAGSGDTFVKRLVGLPGDLVFEDRLGFLWINGRKLDEPYVEPQRRRQDLVYVNRRWRVPRGSYFMVGDNRGQSCDSRAWGSVPRENLIGKSFATYWPPGRITRTLAAAAIAAGAVAAGAAAYRRRRARGVV